MILKQVVAHLEGEGVPTCLIGAMAMATLGVQRSTADVDLLVTDRRVLTPEFWSPIASEDASMDVRRGDHEDPLAGVVRVKRAGERPVDVVVGKWKWQDELIERSSMSHALGVDMRVPRAGDLVLLKLHAGGPQDAWDIEQILLAAGGRQVVASEVETHLGSLGREARELWERIKAGA